MPVVSHPSRKPHFLYACLALLFLISATYRVLDISERVGELRHGREYVRDPFDIDLPEYTIAGVEEEATRAGLKRGDRIGSINGRQMHYSGTDLWVPLRAARAGDPLSVEATRMVDGRQATSTASIVLQPQRPLAPTVLEVASVLLLNVTMPVVCMALGFWVAAVRIRDGRAWLLLFLMLSVAEFGGANVHFLYGRQGFFQPIAAAYQPILANFWPTTMLLFAIYFPDRLPLDRRVWWVKWLAIAPVAARVIGTNPVFEYVARRNPQAALDLNRALESTAGYAGVAFLLFIVAFFVIMGYRTFTEREPDARRRLLLLDAGAATSVLPALAVLIAFLTGRRSFPEWIGFPVLGSLFLFPLTMAYVIVVHRAMDVRVVVRQGLQYLFARGTLRFVQVALMAVVASGAAAITVRAGSLTLQVVMIAAGLSAVLAIRHHGRTLATRVDKRFFREAYDAEQILSELATDVRTIVETRLLLQTIVHRIAGALHIPRVAILLNEGGSLRPAYAVGYGDAPKVALPEEGTTLRRLQRDPHAHVRFDDPNSWVHDISEGEREALAALQPEMLLALSVNRKVLGVVSLGPKRSEEPYSSHDLRLLGSVATQAGLALENSRLTAQIAAEIAEREKAKRELEIAREVQERLFPQVYPPVTDLEYRGSCRPALAVGGDYYDFIQLSPTELGIAIGDISGKGIPAALLMATLRAFLRGQTIRGQADLAQMMVSLNALVYESSAPNRYATFFYGQYDASAHVLRYVNAGHNPPMVFRGCAGNTPGILRLDTGGPVIGLLPTCGYEQGSVTLGGGDLLVAFTDGISEAMNADDQEWGEERLIEVVLSAPTSAMPAALIGHIMAAADSFVGGAPQHDDMTLVIARCHGSH
jgi:sigma-B regulation protein RsbU (phosphoserine phosphatase)